jgi:hypothetical protein
MPVAKTPPKITFPIVFRPAAANVAPSGKKRSTFCKASTALDNPVRRERSMGFGGRLSEGRGAQVQRTTATTDAATSHQAHLRVEGVC